MWVTAIEDYSLLEINDEGFDYCGLSDFSSIRPILSEIFSLGFEEC